MHLLLGEDGVLRVHQFIHENSQRIRIKSIGLYCRITLELRMVEIRHIGLLLQLIDQIIIHGHRLTNFRDTVLDVDVSYV